MSLDTHAKPRDQSSVFLYWLAGLTAVIGLGFAAWPALDSMNPSAEMRNPLVWVNLSTISPGQRKTVYWPFKRQVVFIVHRTPEQIAMVRADDDSTMPFPDIDRNRVLRDEWVVVIPHCRHGLSTPWGQESGDPRGQWGGWQCNSGDAYDLSGRLRNRWGESNFEIPTYYFESDNWLVIGDTL